MKFMCKFLLTLLVGGVIGASSALADDVEQQTFLYGVYTGCMHTLETDPRTASGPQEKKRIMCGCEVNAVKENNIHTQEQFQAAQQEIQNSMATCMQPYMTH